MFRIPEPPLRSEDLMSGAGAFELSDGRSGTFTYAVE
jgi:hypothetical protein